tara:strand:- start:461 stop:655 length:195 start_codon:yes stop_codon:yes gene_type:complete
MTKIKDFLERYNISLTIVGTAIVLSTMFGQCSYDYSSGDVDVSVNPEGAIEEWRGEEEATDAEE